MRKGAMPAPSILQPHNGLFARLHSAAQWELRHLCMQFWVTNSLPQRDKVSTHAEVGELDSRQAVKVQSSGTASTRPQKTRCFSESRFT